MLGDKEGLEGSVTMDDDVDNNNNKASTKAVAVTVSGGPIRRLSRPGA